MKTWLVWFVTTDLREHAVTLEKCAEKDITRKIEEMVGDELVDVIDWYEDEYAPA